MGHFAPEGITLARFLRQLPPEITLVHDAGERPLRWVEASDMDDPTDYLLDEEMILTSGFPLLGHADDRQFVDAFIARLAQAKVSALGFGLEPYFTTIPDAVIEACRAHNLPLIQIPASVPFAAIGIAFAKLTEADNAAQLRANAEANRTLLRCLTHEDPEAQLISTLSQRLRASIKLLSSDGRLRHESSIGQTINFPDELATRLFAEASTAQKLSMHQEAQLVFLTFPLRTAHPAGTPSPLLGVLSLGFAHAPSAFDHSLITTALDLLEVLARERVAACPTSSQLATALLFESRTPLDETTLSLLNHAVGDRNGDRNGDPIRVAVIVAQTQTCSTPTNLHLANLQTLLDTRLLMRHEDYFLAITRATPTQELFERLIASNYIAGFSNETAVDHQLAEKVGDLRAEATGLLPRMREQRRSLDAQTLPNSFLSLLPAQAGKLLARQTLAPILDLPEARRDLYLEVLRGWLEANGSWDQTSKNIDLHRNSVRRHIAAIGEVLDQDLNLAETRHQLYLALTLLSNK